MDRMEEKELLNVLHPHNLRPSLLISFFFSNSTITHFRFTARALTAEQKTTGKS